jgi:hypothetical protein
MNEAFSEFAEVNDSRVIAERRRARLAGRSPALTVTGGHP